MDSVVGWNCSSRQDRCGARSTVGTSVQKDPKGGILVKQTVIDINGCVETKLSHDQWLDDFIDWLESRSESFGGGTKDVTDEEDSE